MVWFVVVVVEGGGMHGIYYTDLILVISNYNCLWCLLVWFLHVKRRIDRKSVV